MTATGKVTALLTTYAHSVKETHGTKLYQLKTEVARVNTVTSMKIFLIKMERSKQTSQLLSKYIKQKTNMMADTYSPER